MILRISLETALTALEGEWNMDVEDEDDEDDVIGNILQTLNSSHPFVELASLMLHTVEVEVDELESEQSLELEDIAPESIYNSDKMIYQQATCTICLEEFATTDTVRTLWCDHVFHRSCIDTWFEKQITCPLCQSSPSTSK